MHRGRRRAPPLHSRIIPSGSDLPASLKRHHRAVTSLCICVTVPEKESAMLNRLLLVWRRFCAWMMPGPAAPTHYESYPQPYQPSNLHARHR